MRNSEKILEEVLEQCLTDNCYSWKIISLLCIEKANKECEKEIIEETIEQLRQITNNYEVVGGSYVIQKTTLDNYIQKLEDKL